MDLQFQPGSSSMLARNVGAGTEEKGDVEEINAYEGRGAGGKLRSSRRSSIRKATPYDRPAHGRHSTAGGLPASSPSAHPSSSLASWLVGSASRLITSSASYFFSSLFGRKSLELTNGNPASVDEEDEKEELDPVTTQEIENLPHQSKKDATNSKQDLVAVGAGIEKKELDLAEVEDMLKQKTWSREQVNRLTDLLNTRLVECPPTISGLAEAGVQASGVAVHTVELTPHRAEGSTFTPIAEAQRWREELKRARTDCVPIEVAKAYMGERTSSESVLSRSFRGTPHQIDRVAELQPPPGLGLTEDRYRSFPVLRSWSRSPATQVPKRSPLLDEDWMSGGPGRRTRQKTYNMNYARGLSAGDPVLSQALVSPPVQSSQTARKILDTLEMMSPSPKARKLHDEPMVATEAPMSLTPDIFNLRGRRNLHRAEISRFSSLRDMSPSNGKLDFGSPSYHPTLTIGAMNESNFEDKTLVNRLLSKNEAPLSSTTGLLSIAANASLTYSNEPVSHTSVLLTTSTTPSSFQLDQKPLFSFSIPSSTAGSQQYADNITVGLPTTVTALSASTSIPIIPASVVTSATCALSTDAASTSIFSPPKEQHTGEKGAATEDQFKGLDATVKELNKVSYDKGTTGFQFGSSSPLAPFSFAMGTDDIAAGGQSKAPFLSPVSSSKAAVGLSSSMLDSSLAITAAVSTAPVLFGSQPGTFPLFKPSTPGQLFGAPSSIMKPSPIQSLMIEPSSAPFTFSPPPAPISCSTPTFCFASNDRISVSGSTEISFEASPLSPAEVPNTNPVFSFTSPAGGSKLPTVVASEDASLPAPKFTFGKGASPPSGELAAGSAPLVASFQSGVASTSVPSSFTFGGQTASNQLFGLGAGSAPLFGSGTGSAPSPSSLPFSGQTASLQPCATVAKSTSSPFSGAESLPSQTQLEPPGSFTSGGAGLEKTGRKFLKAKRRK